MARDESNRGGFRDYVAGRPRWQQSRLQDGAMTITFRSWRTFSEFIHQEFLTYKGYAFRGQSSQGWHLESTLDRGLRPLRLLRSRGARAYHLENFKLAARGRRGSNPPPIKIENEWWALGQHHGLATPLLDWTESPFVALYFAFEDKGREGSRYRVVWALHLQGVEEKSETLLSTTRRRRRRTRPPIVEIVRPMSDENSRLVSQRGLFTRGPDGIPIDDWVNQQFRGRRRGGAILIKFRIPNTDRLACLSFLNRMNINHLSLFPDLLGASQYCNIQLRTPEY